jgi:sugar O-acyltransferase (sialic acid O-acetyltransferase NeuD family)
LNLFIYCCGGFGREVADIAQRINHVRSRWERISFLDDRAPANLLPGTEIYTLANALQHFGPDSMEAVIANGEPFVREALLEKLLFHRIRLATLVDEASVISESAILGDGVIIFPGCYVSSMARIGQNVAMIAGSMLGHDSVVGDNCVISGHVNVGGGCSIGNNSYLGMGTQIRERTRIGQGTIVGMGSIVFSGLPDGVIALGNPCRTLRLNETQRIFNQVK